MFPYLTLLPSLSLGMQSGSALCPHSALVKAKSPCLRVLEASLLTPPAECLALTQCSWLPPCSPPPHVSAHPERLPLSPRAVLTPPSVQGVQTLVICVPLLLFCRGPGGGCCTLPVSSSWGQGAPLGCAVPYPQSLALEPKQQLSTPSRLIPNHPPATGMLEPQGQSLQTWLWVTAAWAVLPFNELDFQDACFKVNSIL